MCGDKTQFEEWQKRDKKIKALSDASPEYFLMPLRNLSITMSDMTSLKVLLEAAPLPWIYHFLDSQGLALTIKFLEHIVFKEYVRENNVNFLQRRLTCSIVSNEQTKGTRRSGL
jgi:hypothetical protein